MIEAVVFDLDDTLIHLPIDYEKLFQELSKIMKTANLRPLAEKISKLDNKTKKKAFEIWQKIEQEAIANMTVNPKGIALYNKFSKKPKVLVTLQGKASVETILNSLGLSFNFVITREDRVDRVEQLKIAAEKLGKPSQNILFIGNMDYDFIAAKKIGCQFLRVKT